MIQWRNTDERYGAVAQVLHWTIFALIALQFVSAELIDAFPRESAGRAAVLGIHESLGLAALALVLIRLSWRTVNPALPGAGPAWQQRLARVAHVGLYVLMVAVPVAGYVVAAARGHDLALFGFTLPQLIGRNRALARTAKDIHEILGWTLAALVGVHAAAAVWHHVVAGDTTLRRMLPRGTGVDPGLGR
jgi:cytochrome b561